MSKPDPDNSAEKDEGKPESADIDVEDAPPREVGGRSGPDPTRYGDWEKAGRCIDF